MKRSRDGSAEDVVFAALKQGIDALSVSSSRSTRELVCRDAQAGTITSFLMDEAKRTLQVFGMPGTGKTATISHVLTKLAGGHSGSSRLTTVYLNGYVVQKRTDIYLTLYAHFLKTRGGLANTTSAERCVENMEKRFRQGWEKKTSLCVIVVDEVDKILEKHGKGLFKVIDWLSLEHTHCKLIMVSNSMTGVEDPKMKSRLDERDQLVFMPYTANELEQIVKSRISGIELNLLSDKTIRSLCIQAASQNGDIRRVLQAASAALCGALIKPEGSSLAYNANTGLVSMQEMHLVVRLAFHDRFIEFIKAIHAPLVFITVVIAARETEHMYNRNEKDMRILLEHLFAATSQAYKKHCSAVRPLTRAAFLAVVDELRQVSFLDLSFGEDRDPVRDVGALFASSEEVYASVLQPFPTIVDACRLHDMFGKSIGESLLS